MALMGARLRDWAFIVRSESISTTLASLLRCSRSRWYALLPGCRLPSTPFIRVSSLRSFPVYMCSDIVKGRGVCLKFARSSWLLALRVYSLALWMFCGRLCDSGGGFVRGCIVAGLWWLNCRRLVCGWDHFCLWCSYRSCFLVDVSDYRQVCVGVPCRCFSGEFDFLFVVRRWSRCVYVVPVGVSCGV